MADTAVNILSQVFEQTSDIALSCRLLVTVTHSHSYGSPQLQEKRQPLPLCIASTEWNTSRDTADTSPLDSRTFTACK